MARCTLLLITSGVSGRRALAEGMMLAEKYVDSLPVDLSITQSCPFAIAPSETIREKVSYPQRLPDPDSAATSVGALQAIWNGRTWLTPGHCPPAPPDSNGATEWQWAHYNAVLNARAGTCMLLWDVYVAPMTERLAA